MTSQVRVYRTERVWNAETKQHDETQTNVYAGRGKVQFFDNSYEQTPEAGAHTFVVGRVSLHLPVSATGVTVGHLVEVTADALNPHLLGRKWRVTNLAPKSHQTALRMPIEEVIA